MAAARLPENLRNRAIVMGIGAAAGLRVIFALLAVHLMKIIGMTIAGGLLLLWVAWRLWREMLRNEVPDPPSGPGAGGTAQQAAVAPPDKTLRQAVTQIFIADLSMSLDNVLAVAGAARDHVWVLVVGLALSVILMAFAAAMVAKLIDRHRWIAYGGLIIILYVALSMIWDGSRTTFGPLLPDLLNRFAH